MYNNFDYNIFVEWACKMWQLLSYIWTKSHPKHSNWRQWMAHIYTQTHLQQIHIYQKKKKKIKSWNKRRYLYASSTKVLNNYKFTYLKWVVRINFVDLLERIRWFFFFFSFSFHKFTLNPYNWHQWFHIAQSYFHIGPWGTFDVHGTWYYIGMQKKKSLK